MPELEKLLEAIKGANILLDDIPHAVVRQIALDWPQANPLMCVSQARACNVEVGQCSALWSTCLCQKRYSCTCARCCQVSSASEELQKLYLKLSGMGKGVPNSVAHGGVAGRPKHLEEPIRQLEALQTFRGLGLRAAVGLGRPRTH